MATQESATVSITVDAPFERVAADLSDPRTHPEWASEFFAGPLEAVQDGEFAANVPAMGGAARYRLEADASRGIFDIFLAPAGSEFGPPLPVRLVANGSGVDVLWTLHRQPGTPDAGWHAGVESMRRELVQLKARHEGA